LEFDGQKNGGKAQKAMEIQKNGEKLKKRWEFHKFNP